MPSELKERNNILLKYCNLRIEIFETFQKAIGEESDKYAEEINNLHSKMELVLKELK